MALQLSLADTNVGLPAPAAYGRVVAIQVDVLQSKVQVAINVYASKSAREAGKNPVAGGQFLADLVASGSSSPGINPDAPEGIRTNAYTYLKTLPDFSGSVDV